MSRFSTNPVLDNLQRPPVNRPRAGLLFVAIAVGHVILISSQVQSGAGVPVLEAVSFTAFARVQQAAAGAFRSVRGAWTGYLDLRGARAENEALRSRIGVLEIRLQEQRALAERAERLQALLDLKQSLGIATVAAEVIAGYANPSMLTVTIDRGSRDGVMENMAVLVPEGIVGRVIGPIAAHAARVQLIIDSSAAAGALIERTREGGMVVGQEGDPPLRMELVSNLADVQPGDEVVTSGAEGIYPRGFRIGRVERSERGPQLYRVITVRPYANFRGLEEVLVVLLPPRSAVADETDPPAGGPAR